VVVKSREVVKQSGLRHKKPSCPFMRQCFSDSTVCGYIGKYAECLD
jgi:hypothetical protein